MIQRFRIGNNLSVEWRLFEDDGNIHLLEGKETELYMTCGGYKYPVTSYTVTENAVAWVFPAAMQTKTGYYRLVLLERDPVRGLYSFDVADAFCLEPKDALTNIETIIDEDATVQVRSVLTYAHITNLASIDVVDSYTEEGIQNVTVHLTNGKSFTLPIRGGSGSGGEGGVVTVINNLTSYDTTAALSANMGRELKRLIDALPQQGVQIVNDLVSGGTNKALSAEMGKRLKEMIDNIPGSDIDPGFAIEVIDSLTSSATNKALSANMGRYLKQLIDEMQIPEYVLPPATTNALGGIMLGFTRNDEDKNYPVQLTGGNLAFVHVPWSGGEGDGTPGGHWEQAFRATASDVELSSADLPDDGPIDDTDTSAVWKHYAPNNFGATLIIWMAVRWVDGNGDPNPWNGPWCISGGQGVPGNDGDAGIDGDKYEYIYARTTSENVAPPAITYTTNRGKNRYQDDFVPVNWYDNAHYSEVQVTSTYRVVWFCMRIKEHTEEHPEGVWSDFIGPFPWTVWGRNGMDGDGVEYIFYTGETYPTGNTNLPHMWSTSADGYQTTPEYIPDGSDWVDDPVSPQMGETVWVSIRRRHEDNGEMKWGAYSEPSVWSRNPYDGTAGDGIVADLDNDTMAIPIKETGYNYAYGPQKAFPTLYNGAAPVSGAEITDMVVTMGTTDITSSATWVTYENPSDSDSGEMEVIVDIDEDELNLEGKVIKVRLTISKTENAGTEGETTTVRPCVLQIFGVNFGSDGASYNLVTNGAVIRRNKDGSSSPSTLSPTVTKVKGEDAITSYTAAQASALGFTIKYAVDDDTQPTTLAGNTIPSNDINRAGTSVRVELHYDQNGTDVIVDQESVLVVAGGDDAIRLDLDNENDTILYNKEGTKVSPDIQSTATLFEGSTDVSANATFSISSKTSGMTATISGRTVTVSAATQSGFVMVKARYKGMDYYSKLTIKRQVGDVKYDLFVTPSSVSYNTTTQELSHETIYVNVRKGFMNASGEWTVDEDAKGMSSSTQSLYVEIDNATVITENIGPAYSIGGSFSVDPSLDYHVVRLIKRTKDISVMPIRYTYETIDEETIPICKSANGAKGDPGESALTADLSNEVDAVQVGTDGILSTAVNLGTSVIIALGADTQPITSLTADVPSVFSQNITVTRGQTINNRATLNVTIAANTNFNSLDRVEIPITVTCAKGSRTATYTILAVKSGKDGSVYHLVPETDVIIGRYSGNSLSYDYNTVSCSRYIVSGGNAGLSTEGTIKYSVDGGTNEVPYSGPVSVSNALSAGKIIFYWYIGSLLVDRETVPILKDGLPGSSTAGKDAVPIRLRNWSDVAGKTLTGNQKVFSGFEENAPFKDLIVITAANYVGTALTYPFDDGNATIVGINYSSSREGGWNGTELVLPVGGVSKNYSETYPASKEESAAQRAESISKVWYVFQSLGAIFAQILVAMKAYIEEGTIKVLTTNVDNGSYITMEGGFICFYDGDGNLRIQMGQGASDSSPVLKFFDTDGETELYDLGPAGLRNNGPVTIPTWTKKQFFYSSNAFTTGTNLKVLTANDLYRYEDGYMLIYTAGANYGTINFMDPYDTTQYIGSNHSALDGQYFDAFPNKVTAAWVAAHATADGYYISHQVYWNSECDGYEVEEDSDSYTGYSDYFTGVTAFRVQTVNGQKVVTPYDCTVKVYPDSNQVDKWQVVSFTARS